MINWAAGNIMFQRATLPMKNITGYLSWLNTQANWQPRQSYRRIRDFHSISALTPWQEHVLEDLVSVCQPMVLMCCLCSSATICPFPLRPMAGHGVTCNNSSLAGIRDKAYNHDHQSRSITNLQGFQVGTLATAEWALKKFFFHWLMFTPSLKI